jgi:hypothetical protein
LIDIDPGKANGIHSLKQMYGRENNKRKGWKEHSLYRSVL